MKPFPDPTSSPADAVSADPTAASWRVKETNGAENGANAEGGEVGAAFTPTIRKGAAQMFKVAPEAPPTVEAQSPQPLPSNSGKKVSARVSSVAL